MKRFSFALLVSLSLVTNASAAKSIAGDLGPDASCDKAIPAITQGYGVDGPFKPIRKTIKQSDFPDPIEVFLPDGKTDRTPVMFFSHGYGPNVSAAYKQFIDHAVSRGIIVVFAPYPMDGTMTNRYNILWNGFVRATETYATQMDLSRLAVVGHSFGGGAVPTIAYRAFKEKGWGKNGGLAFSLAPWYTQELTTQQWSQIPSHILFATQVYDRDVMNDHRMAIHQYATTPGRTHLYFKVNTLKAGDCEMTAVHALPGRTPSLRIKQYGLFRPFDALTDAVFKSGPVAISAVENLSKQLSAGKGYQPLQLLVKPSPTTPQSAYEFPWSSPLNPAAKGRTVSVQ